MTEEQVKDYALRITQANASGLAVIINELAQDSMKEAVKFGEQENWEEYRRYIKKAERYVGELIHGLNYEDPAGRIVGDNYIQVHRDLIQARMTLDASWITAASQQLEKLEPVFVRIAKEDGEPPIMANTQKVYAGLTYGRTSLNEMAVDPKRNRGYTV